MKTRPLFIIKDPSFLGLSTEEGEKRAEKYNGSRNTQIGFNSLYVHGALEKHCGFDIASFAQGTIKDKDLQRTVVVDAEDKKHDSILVSVKYNNKRCGLIVYKAEAKETYEYLKKERDAAQVSGFTRMYI